MSSIPELIATEAAAQRLGVDRRTIQRWVTSGALVPIPIAGLRGPKVFLGTDVDALLHKRQPPAA